MIGGALEGARANELAEAGRKIFEYYQERSIYVGDLKPESALTEFPSGPTVFFGEVQAFEHPGWLEPLIEIDGGRTTVGGITFSEDPTGFYVRSADEQRVIFLSLIHI